MGNRLTISYYPWITQAIGGQELAKAVADFGAALQAELSKGQGAVSVTVLPEMTIPEQIAALSGVPAEDDAKLALMNPIGYAITHERISSVESVCVVRRRVAGQGPSPKYRAQIYTSILSGIRSLADLRKRTFAFGSPQSTSNFLVPAHVLWKAGIHPLNSFSRLDFSGGHDLVAKAVYEGRVDAGAGHDGVIIDLANKKGYGNAAERLVRLEWSEDIPSDPVVLHVKSDEFRKRIVTALLAIAPPTDSTTAGNRAIELFWGTSEGLEGCGPADYRSLLRYASDLSLYPEDFIRPW